MSLTQQSGGDGFDSLPRWDLSGYFDGLDSREFAAAEESAGTTIDRLVSLYDRHNVRATYEGEISADAFEEVLAATNATRTAVDVVQAYVHSFVSTDAGNETAQAALSRLRSRTTVLQTLASRFDGWVAAIGADQLVELSAEARAHEWPLRKAALRATHQMSEAEESLAAELSLTGRSAWSQLYADVTARMSAVVELPTGAKELPIFAIRGLATDADAHVRRAAYVAELDAWEKNAVPLAAALNAIKGEQQLLAERRGWPSVLDAQVFGQASDAETLAAMQSAMIDSFPHFRRYFQAKAGLLGRVDGLRFYDLFAPVGESQNQTWPEATAAVDVAFGSYSPQLRSLARRAVDESWIDVAPRSGKQGGAFCMPMGDGDSRILLNFEHSTKGIMTLAHELGHAYHNLTMTERTPIQRGTPSSLAETASIFCETIMVKHGLASEMSDAERLALLETDLQGSAQVIVDIHSRFLFESSVFAERKASTLSVDRFCDLMDDAQAATYGDGLDPDYRHRFMWAAKPHYYGSLFYNWPYAFGLLFGLGLYARYDADPDRFRSGYDDLLSSTGLGDAASLAYRFDIDIRDKAFWASSLGVVTNRINDYCELAAVSPNPLENQ